MINKLLLLGALIPFAVLPNNSQFDKSSFNNDCFNISSTELVSVKDDHKNDTELRIYSSDDFKIESINSEAFKNCIKLESIMLSTTVKSLPETVFDCLDSFKTINYTGSIEEFELIGYLNSKQYTINEYSCDEGFLNYWKKNVRPNETSSLCDVPKDIYNQIENLYKNLSDEDIASIKDVQDGNGTIEQSIKYLRELHSNQPQESRTHETSKTTMIVLILIIASIGMTFICVFYLLRERKIIE